MGSIGEELGDVRRKKGISLEKVEEAIKVRIKFLEAIEKNDFQTLPETVYTKGFIRAYAGYLGVNPQPYLNQYKLLHQSQENYALKEMPKPVIRHESYHINKRWLLPIAMVVSIFMIISFLGFIGSSEKSKPNKPSTFITKRKKVKPKPKPSKSLPFEITLQAIRGNWVKVIIDNKPVFEQYMYNGQQMRWLARNTVVVVTNHGNRLIAFINRKPVGFINSADVQSQKVFKKTDIK
ncbi:MAG: hypothetical protein C4562_06535 [Actinobacteria bacterium]|nr:MAG: hypothetical protein C4562_06535 [Actinomycetota bacterium]